MSANQGNILVVDDHATNRMKMSMASKNLGHLVETASDGKEALDMMQEAPFDLILLDIMMPEMDGYEVLKKMKTDSNLNMIPVIVISAVDEMDSVIQAIELGAEDYLPKSFDPVLLKARINACLEKKRLRDKMAQQLDITQELFGKFVPERIAESILQGKGFIKPMYTTATIMFTDIYGFTRISEGMEPARVADMLNQYFPSMIEPINKYGGVLNQFLGDSMMVVFNVPVNDQRHADNALNTAKEIQKMAQETEFEGHHLKTRIGMCTGEVFAGNVGSGDRMHYTILGDSVNVASRLEQLNKQYGTEILISKSTADALQDDHNLRPIGEIEIRGRSAIDTYTVS